MLVSVSTPVLFANWVPMGCWYVLSVLISTISTMEYVWLVLALFQTAVRVAQLLPAQAVYKAIFLLPEILVQVVP